MVIIDFIVESGFQKVQFSINCTFQIAIVLNKVDKPLPRDPKEILGVLRFDDLVHYCRQTIKCFEVSAVSGKGLKALTRWIWGEEKPKVEE